MGMFDWTERPASVLQQGGVIAPDERLPWPQTAAMGVQHVIAMFGATVLAPILMGFNPNIAILMSGIGTLLFFFITGGRVPSYLGSSFAFIGTSESAPTTFLAAVTNTNGGFTTATGSGLLGGTGLTAGSTALVLPPKFPWRAFELWRHRVRAPRSRTAPPVASDSPPALWAPPLTMPRFPARKPRVPCCRSAPALRQTAGVW